MALRFSVPLPGTVLLSDSASKAILLNSNMMSLCAWRTEGREMVMWSITTAGFSHKEQYSISLKSSHNEQREMPKAINTMHKEAIHFKMASFSTVGNAKYLFAFFFNSRFSYKQFLGIQVMLWHFSLKTAIQLSNRHLNNALFSSYTTSKWIKLCAFHRGKVTSLTAGITLVKKGAYDFQCPLTFQESHRIQYDGHEHTLILRFAMWRVSLKLHISSTANSIALGSSEIRHLVHAILLDLTQL